jgi:hypothetical protein
MYHKNGKRQHCKQSVVPSGHCKTEKRIQIRKHISNVEKVKKEITSSVVQF